MTWRGPPLLEHVHFERFGKLWSGDSPREVAFEATMNWGWLYDLLEEIKGVERIVMANPHCVRLIAAAQIKTDKVDARKLARLLRAGMLPASHIPDPVTRARKRFDTHLLSLFSCILAAHQFALFLISNVAPHDDAARWTSIMAYCVVWP